jgi:hypothetical protein
MEQIEVHSWVRVVGCVTAQNVSSILDDLSTFSKRKYDIQFRIHLIHSPSSNFSLDPLQFFSEQRVPNGLIHPTSLVQATDFSPINRVLSL